MTTPCMWTEECAQFLRDNWDKMSALEVAIALGAQGWTFTRNAVIGKAHRLGLLKGARGVALRPNTKMSRQLSLPKALRVPKPRKKVFKPMIIINEPLRISFRELTHQTCKFECSGYDAPDPAAFVFCGHPVQEDRPYCAHHWSISHEQKKRPLNLRPFRRAA